MRSRDDRLFIIQLVEGMLALACAYTVVMVFVYGAPQSRAGTPLLVFVLAAFAWLVTLRLGAHGHPSHR